MILGISVIIYVFSTIPLVSLLKIRQIPRYLCAFFVIFIAEIVLTGNVLGMLKQLNNKGLWLAIQSLIICFSWITWVLLNRPALFSFQTKKPRWNELRFLQKISLILLSLVVIAGYSTLVYLILAVPPNNNDSMVVHLVRVGYWLQHGSFLPWDSFIARQVIYPYNAQIVVLWTILFHGTDLLAAFLQFISVIFTSLGIYSIAREIGGNRFQAAVAALFYLTFPQVILQATTTQDDLVITCFLILGAYFFLRWYGKSFVEMSDLILASISLMIAIGIKPTAFYFFIGFGIFILVIICFKKMNYKQLLQLVISCTVLFLVFSSYAYFNNLIYYHNPLGPAQFVKSESGAFTGNIIRKVGVNTGRFFYQFISLDGLPTPIIQKIQDVKILLAAKLPSVFNTTADFIKDPSKPFQLSDMPGINEDLSWFGPASFLLLLPAILIGIYKGIMYKDFKIVFLLIVPFFMIIGIGALRPGWDPYQGRYFNPGIALCMPLVIFLITPKMCQQIYQLLISVLAILITISSVLLNESKPMITQTTIYKNFTSTSCDENLVNRINCYISSELPRLLLDREDIFSLSFLQKETYTSPGQYTIIKEYEKEIPAKSRIGLFLQNGDWEYPYFGRNFEYQLVPILNQENLKDLSWLEQNRLNYILVHLGNDQQIIVNPTYSLIDKILDPQNSNSIWLIYKR